MGTVERRRAVVRAAFVEFARRGYDATTTTDIALRAGISQPYVYKLFPTKRDLFLAAAELCFERWCELLTTAAAGLAGQPAFDAMNEAVLAQAHGELPVFALKLYAAGHDRQLARMAGRHVTDLQRTIVRAAGADDARVDHVLGTVLLLQTTSTMDLEDPALVRAVVGRAPLPGPPRRDVDRAEGGCNGSGS